MNVQNMLTVSQRNGFVFIENIFSKTTMNEVNSVMITWDIEQWNNFA